MPLPIITLTTDFGTQSHYVGSMKGVILSINPSAIIVDITHDLPPFDILQAAFILESATKCFPVPSIHVAVVDPGVGSDRKVLLAVGEKHYYIAPDNGILTRIIKSDSVSEIRVVDEEHYMLPRTVETFHGRDVFAPIAAWLSKYFNSQLFGEPVESAQQMDIAAPKLVKDKVLECRILFADRFGNLITNLEMEIFTKGSEKYGSSNISVQAGAHTVKGLSRHYCAVPNRGDPLVLFGSLEMMEIAVREGSAEKTLGLHAGDLVYVTWE